MCLCSILLSRPCVVWVYGMNPIEVRLLLVFVVRVAGFRAHHICWGLYPLSLKSVMRNSSSWVRESWSQLICLWVTGKQGLSVCLQDGDMNSVVDKDWCGCRILTTDFHLRPLPSTVWSFTRHPSFRLAQATLRATFTCIKTPAFSSRLCFLLTSPMKMEETECSETSGYQIQMPGKHPKERLRSYIFDYTSATGDGFTIVFKWDEFRVSCTGLWFAMRSLEWGVLASTFLPHSTACHGKTQCDKVMSICSM
jgi:hypothetical protein